VLQAVRETQKPIRLVYASSSAIYGDAQKLPCCDDQAPSPAMLSPYALQKAQNEQYAALYDRLFQVRSLALRYFNVYGSRQDPQSVYSGVISRFLDRYNQGLDLTIYGDGSQLRDFIHVDDVVRANCLALEGDYSGVLNIATGEPETLNSLLSYIEETGGQRAQLCYLAARLGDIHASYAATQKAEQHLGFRHLISLREGIRRLMLGDASPGQNVA
jgi:UDP-glucose 4-epimerase